MGALYRHVTGAAHPPGTEYQPSNVTYGLFPPLPGRVPKAARREAHAARARAALAGWMAPRAVESLPAASAAVAR